VGRIYGQVNNFREGVAEIDSMSFKDSVVVGNRKMLSLTLLLGSSLAIGSCGPSATSSLHDPVVQNAGYCIHEEPGSFTYTPEEGDPKTIKTVMYRPARISGSDCSTSWPQGTFPLIIFSHGNTYSYKSYSYVGKHLAANGFVFLSLESGNISVDARAARMIQALKHIQFNHPEGAENGGKIEPNIALMGHSRGGEGAVLAAKRLPLEDWNQNHVRAVIALAPSDRSSEEQTGEDLYLAANESPAFLVIYGSYDGDVTGQSQTIPSAKPSKHPHTPFSLWDRVGEHPSFSPRQRQVTKSFFYIYGANHHFFANKVGVPAFDNNILIEEQHNFVKGYANAFLRWHLRGETSLAGFFDGRRTPGTIRDDGVQFYTQYHGPGRRKVVDDFSNGQTINSLGGTVTVSDVFYKTERPWEMGTLGGLGAIVGYPLAGDTPAAHIMWNSQDNPPRIQWSIPKGERDVSAFEFLEFRTEQMYLSKRNKKRRQDFSVQLSDSFSTAATVRVSSFQVIPQADVYISEFPDDPNKGVDNDFTKTPIVSVRIPLSAFINQEQSLNLGELSEISLIFDPGSTGELVLDDLRFSINLHP
jgi:pimeloyl-ACP methyl ester carboxylesterase